LPDLSRRGDRAIWHPAQLSSVRQVVNYRRSDDWGWEGEVKSMRRCCRGGQHEGDIIAQNGHRYGSHQALEAHEGRDALKRPTT
jgi:hypothetical protein